MKDALRRYGAWAGNPEGTPEDISLCIERVSEPRGIPHQCNRKRGHGKDGLYCKTHDPEKVAARRAKSDAKFEAYFKATIKNAHYAAWGPHFEAALREVRDVALESDRARNTNDWERLRAIVDAALSKAGAK